MSMDREDNAREAALDDLQYEAVMQQATRAQCIYLFVEGASEEAAFPILLEAGGLNLERLGIVIANYNGIGNLSHIIRLLSKTLSHDRPVVITFDDDYEGQKFIQQQRPKLIYEQSLLTFFPIPSKPVVRYRDGHMGGSFEEAFTADQFISAYIGDEDRT